MANPNEMLFFDGDCGLCQRSVQALLKHDRREVMCFAPLSGETAKETLTALGREELFTVDSVVWVEDGRAYSHSSAGIRALAACGGLWTLAKVFLFIPPFLRDIPYRWIAKRRRRFFKDVSCKIPTPEESRRMLP